MGMRSSVTGLVIFCIEGSFELGSLVVSVRQGILDFLGHGASVPLGPTKHVRGRYRSISGGKFEHVLARTRRSTQLIKLGKGNWVYSELMSWSCHHETVHLSGEAR